MAVTTKGQVPNVTQLFTTFLWLQMILSWSRVGIALFRVLILIMLETEYSGFGNQCHA